MYKIWKDQTNCKILLFMCTYMVSYITRINYGAIISEIVVAEQMLKSELALAVTGSFFSYGIGQLVSGIIGDKIQPRLLVFTGLVCSSCMNVMITICDSPYHMSVVWCINGFAQSFMWPPIIKLMSSVFSSKDYKRATEIVSWGGSLGTIAIYLAAPIFISIWGWRSVFWGSATCAVFMAVVWFLKSEKITLERTYIEKNLNFQNKSVVTLFIGIGATIIIQGALRDGVTTWMPSYCIEMFSMDNSTAIMTGVLLPIFSIIGFRVTSILYKRKFNNEMQCGSFMFGIGSIATFGLWIVAEDSKLLSVILMVLLVGCMHGVNLILVCMTPAYFGRYGIASFVSGVLNSCSYVGSAVSTFLIVIFAENYGWKNTIVIWLLMTLIGTSICLWCTKKWKMFASEG